VCPAAAILTPGKPWDLEIDVMRAPTLVKLFGVALGLLVSADWLPNAERTAASRDWTMYIGSYTQPPSKGIYYCRFDPATGEAGLVGLAAETENPSFIAIHPNHRFLYAANEISSYAGYAAGSIRAFAIDAVSGRLKLLNKVPSK